VALVANGQASVDRLSSGLIDTKSSDKKAFGDSQVCFGSGGDTCPKSSLTWGRVACRVDVNSMRLCNVHPISNPKYPKGCSASLRSPVFSHGEKEGLEQRCPERSSPCLSSHCLKKPVCIDCTKLSEDVSTEFVPKPGNYPEYSALTRPSHVASIPLREGSLLQAILRHLKITHSA
jgi:hypothetical protein